MRKAFVGLSTPVGYDYTNPATKTTSDQRSSPNPILDSPFGLMLLFDEIVFLSKSLCPENMRSLPYVTFLDDSKRLPLVTQEEIASVGNAALGRFGYPHSFQEAIRNAGVLEEMGVDNHTHGLKFGEFNGFANSDERNLAIDMLFHSRLNDSSIELITNSNLRPLDTQDEDVWGKLKLTELLVVENIPNFLSKKGPYHPVIDEVRENKYLKEFREWIVQQSGLAGISEVTEMKEQVERALQEAQEELFMKHLDPSRHFKTVGEAMLGDLAGLICPVAGTAKALAGVGNDLLKSESNRWQGFVVGAKRTIRRNF
ncbi:TPA: hypothetical protein P0E05_001482 [Vibrio fluvialis]|nr:hypothetical protein [Vibrio fluvialis]